MFDAEYFSSDCKRRRHVKLDSPVRILTDFDNSRFSHIAPTDDGPGWTAGLFSTVRLIVWRIIAVMKVFATATSLRMGSFNRKLINLAAGIMRTEGHEVDLANFHEFDMPFYDADLQEAVGMPAGALELARRINESDACVMAVPEYNYSIPGILKNAIEWLSRMEKVPLANRTMNIISAAPSPVGGNRGLWQTRIPLECVGAWLYPGMFSLAQADLAFNEDGTLKDPALSERLVFVLKDYLSVTAAFNVR
ncbi:MAG: NAD(P)H-dependent oxidoreductase [Pseudomonadota bacterium]|nr:NAD(P)H-dependent oxidoreductase [Pseudomonadota bacterium]